MHRFAARRLAWNLGLADDRLTKNFETTRGVLLQLISRGVIASDEILPRLKVEAERSIMPGRTPGLLPGAEMQRRGYQQGSMTGRHPGNAATCRGCDARYGR